MTVPWNNQLQSLVIVTAPAGQYAGIFVYSPAPGLGNLIGSWAAQAGTDPFGNSYPQGLNVAVGSISGTTFTGVNFIINTSGLFFYNGTPALGNLLISVAPSNGTDRFGNIFYEGSVSYAPSGSATASIAAVLQEGSLLLGPPGILFSPFAAPGIFGAASPGGSITLQSGEQNSSTDQTAIVNLVSLLTNTSGSGTPAMQLQNNCQLNINAGGGPFIANETFHNLSNPSGFTGTMRVKKLPWNAIWYDLEGSTNAAGTFTFGAPPDISYNPLVARHWDIGGAAANQRLFVPTSGGPQVITSAAATVGGTWMVPTN